MNGKLYIPNLNGLRFMAAFGVVLGHIELSKRLLGLDNFIDQGVGFFKNGGGHNAVILFFVLSGFLITLLLIKEKDRFKTVKIRKFLIRRALRIWPVYFLFITFVIFAFFGLESILADKDDGLLSILLYYLILPNLAMCGFGSIQHIAHLWSIGVEEQFYLIWPFILKYFKKEGVIIIMISLVFIVPIIPHLADFLSVRLPDYSVELRVLKLFFQYFLINSMAIGGIIAYLYVRYEKLMKKRLNNLLLLGLMILFMIPWILGISFGYLNDIIYPLMFGALILVSSISPEFFILENNLINYLGKISYGVYVYHWIIASVMLNYINKQYGEVNYLLSTSLILLFTVLVAILSYELIEKPILKYKSKFALIKSGKL